ncbi:hypothetical protein K458DRAFT_375478 [Lentithecium fluviatile CBS 122367]|uniref:Uncharacterized protein n=1 Tax=Lentithecium fluviatile CBS 122367 TaxID=1168545 RepID=A0A6G1IM55_9PLEO|nr:hypothetical protein K458DRAFT_375478 [Lentithecium fluviatile CBS 122367]
MSKSKKSEVQLPGLVSKLKPKPKTPVAPPRAALSLEFIDSGDDSSNEESTPKKTKTPVQIGIHPPRPNAVAKSTSKVPKPRKEASKPPAKAKVPAKKPAPKQVMVEEQGAESSNSSEESEDEGAYIKAAQQRQAASTSSGDSESASSSNSSSEESEEEPAPKATPRAATSQPKPSHTVEFQAPRPYIPPKDFAPVPTARASTFPSTALFDNLEGKQVWHITAPADLSLKNLKELAMGQAMQGDAIISQKGIEYGFLTAESDEVGAREVVIPRENGYKTVPKRISQTLNIRQVINLPKLSLKQADPNTGSEAAASITRSTIRVPRPQVKGLKMRYFPSGVADHTPITLGFSDSEDEAPPAPPAGLGVPNENHIGSKSEKRKHAEVNGDGAGEHPSKKHKKHMTAEEIQRKAQKKAKKERRRQKELAKMKS